MLEYKKLTKNNIYFIIANLLLIIISYYAYFEQAENLRYRSNNFDEVFEKSRLTFFLISLISLIAGLSLNISFFIDKEKITNIYGFVINVICFGLLLTWLIGGNYGDMPDINSSFFRYYEGWDITISQYVFTFLLILFILSPLLNKLYFKFKENEKNENHSKSIEKYNNLLQLKEHSLITEEEFNSKSLKYKEVIRISNFEKSKEFILLKDALNNGDINKIEFEEKKEIILEKFID